MFSIVVKDLATSVNERDLRKKFDCYGEIEDVFLPLDARSRYSDLSEYTINRGVADPAF